MPISGSSSRSRATRCSADRPWMPNASRSPRTSCTCLSAVTRPSPLPLSDTRTRPVWHGRSRASWQVERARLVQRVQVDALDLELAHAGPAGLERELGAVLLGDQADRGRLDPHRQVLGHDRDVVALVGEVAGHRQDAGVVVAEAESGRQRGRVGVVELDPDRAALVADRQGFVERAVQRPGGRRGSAGRCGRSSRALGSCRLPSSSVITTTGMTTSCSWKRLTALGSASRTLVSRTYVRRTGLVLASSCVAATAVSSTSPRAPCAGPTRGPEIGAQGRASTHLERTAAGRRFRARHADRRSQGCEQWATARPWAERSCGSPRALQGGGGVRPTGRSGAPAGRTNAWRAGSRRGGMPATARR